MKKILLLIIGLTIISCSSDDADVVVRTTEPIIGTWRCDPCFDPERGTILVYSFSFDGNFTFSITGSNGAGPGSISGSWTNLGSDFNALSQTYRKNFPVEVEENPVDFTYVFSKNFNEMSREGEIYIRQ